MEKIVPEEAQSLDEVIEGAPDASMADLYLPEGYELNQNKELEIDPEEKVVEDIAEGEDAAPKGEDTEVEKEADNGSKSNRGNKAIREQIELANQRAKALEDQLKTREDELNKEINLLKEQSNTHLTSEQELKEKLEQLEAERETARIRGWEGEAKEHPLVKEVEQKFLNGSDSEWAKVAMSLPSSEEAKKFFQDKKLIFNLHSDFEKLGSPNDVDFFERKAEFQEKLEEQFPNSWKQVMPFFSEISSFWKNYDGTVDKIKNDKGEYLYNERKQAYDKQLNTLTDLEKSWLNPVIPQGVDNHPVMIIEELIKSDQDFAKAREEVLKEIKQDSLQEAPLSVEEITKLTPNQRRERDASLASHKHKTWEKQQTELYQGKMALKALSIQARELAEAKARLKEIEDGMPEYRAGDIREDENKKKKDLSKLTDREYEQYAIEQSISSFIG